MLAGKINNIKIISNINWSVSSVVYRQWFNSFVGLDISIIAGSLVDIIITGSTTTGSVTLGGYQKQVIRGESISSTVPTLCKSKENTQKCTNKGQCYNVNIY